MSVRRRGLLLTVAVQLAVGAIIAVGFITDHVVAAIFVVVGLLVLSGFAANIVSYRRARAGASSKRS